MTRSTSWQHVTRPSQPLLVLSVRSCVLEEDRESHDVDLDVQRFNADLKKLHQVGTPLT